MAEGSDPCWYFAYGSNMEPATFRGRRGIEYAHALPARARGWRLVFDKPPLVSIGESYANIIAEPASDVLGVLYAIDANGLAHLDLSEGVLIGNYQRISLAVTPLTGEPPVDAFTLVSEKRVQGLLPSKRYMACLINGALEHGLPEKYVAFLRSLPANPETDAAREFRPFINQALRRRRGGDGPV